MGSFLRAPCQWWAWPESKVGGAMDMTLTCVYLGYIPGTHKFLAPTDSRRARGIITIRTNSSPAKVLEEHVEQGQQEEHSWGGESWGDSALAPRPEVPYPCLKKCFENPGCRSSSRNLLFLDCCVHTLDCNHCSDRSK